MTREQRTATKVAVIGLGAMGSGMAASLARAAFSVRGFDRRPEAMARLEEGGVTGAASAAEACAQADIVVLVVVNADQTEAALFGDDGVLGATKRGAVIVSSATMAPERARALATAVEGAGRLYLDAPISGGAARAAQGALTILVSGSRQAQSLAAPALDAMGAKIYDLGEEAGVAAAFKMVNQLLAGVHIAVACEAIVFAKKLGLDIAKVIEVVSSSAGNSWMFENRTPHVLEGDYRPRSAVNIFTKDLGIIADMSRSEKFPTPMASQALQMFLMTAAQGMGEEDDASVARLYADIAGVELPAAKLQAPADDKR
ncbi:MAG TPA: L-threonate dehydrogenase [Roseiarcus sp.]|nr:L-threonate dehydrogenase [Roseiarcus sp.]